MTQCPAEPGAHSSHCRPLYSEATLRLASHWSHRLDTGLALVEAGSEARCSDAPYGNEEGDDACEAQNPFGVAIEVQDEASASEPHSVGEQ